MVIYNDLWITDNNDNVVCSIWSSLF